MTTKQKKVKKVWLSKAYNNIDFLNSPQARLIRILSEMIEPAARLQRHHIRNTVVFFGSARTPSREVALRKWRAVEKEVRRSKTSRKKIELAQKAKQDLEISNYYEAASELSQKLTNWFNTAPMKKHNFVICSGGGPGIMEAANRGAQKVKGQSMGLNINLPLEQDPNRFQTKDISFEFHYFFIRKFWFFYLAKALVVFPGGFGTFDELFELLTLIQTEKTKKYMPVVLFGKNYWNEVVNFDAMVKWGTISKEDLKLFRIFDDVDEAFSYLQKELTDHFVNKRTKYSS